MRILTESYHMLTPEDRAIRLYNPAALDSLVAWWSADDIDLADGGAVDSWVARVGGFEAYQTNSTYQPALKKQWWNGHNAVKFDHTADTYLQIARDAALEPANISIFAAYMSYSGEAEGRIVCRPYNTTWASAPYISYDLRSDRGAAFYVGGDVCVAGSVIAAETGIAYKNHSPVFAAVTFNGVTLTAYLFDAAKGTPGSATGSIDYTNAADMCLGTRSPYSPGESTSAAMAELLIFNEALSSDDRTYIFNFLSERYGVPLWS